MQRLIDKDISSNKSAGYLYYVCLETEIGRLYKIGFTTLGSVQERLGYQGGFHDDYVDRVLLFIKLPDAFEVEQKLHRMFEHKKAFLMPSESLPLYGNGQSETYIEDVLGLDISVDREAAKVESREVQYRINMLLFTPPEEVKLLGPLKLIKPKSEKSSDVEALDLLIHEVYESISKKFSWLSILLRPISLLINFLFTSQSERIQKEEKIKILSKLKKESNFYIFDLLRSLSILDDPVNALESDTRAAISAFSKKDLQGFEDLVDIPKTIDGIFSSYNKYNNFYSDYLGQLNNCYMINLMEAMDKSDSPIDLMKAPLQLTYRPLIRYFVRNHRILHEDMVFPSGSLYEADADEGSMMDSSAHPYSDYYGPKKFLDALGRDWSLDNPLITIPQKNRLHFYINVKNTDTGFSGKLLVRVVRNPKNNKIHAVFPNLRSLIWDSIMDKYPDLYREDSVNRDKSIATGVVVSEEDEDWDIPISGNGI